MIVQFEGPQLMQYGFKEAAAKVGAQKLVWDLFLVGLLYHLYNQVTSSCNMQVTKTLVYDLFDYLSLLTTQSRIILAQIVVFPYAM